MQILKEFILISGFWEEVAHPNIYRFLKILLSPISYMKAQQLLRWASHLSCNSLSFTLLSLTDPGLRSSTHRLFCMQSQREPTLAAGPSNGALWELFPALRMQTATDRASRELHFNAPHRMLLLEQLSCSNSLLKCFVTPLQWAVGLWQPWKATAMEMKYPETIPEVSKSGAYVLWQTWY